MTHLNIFIKTIKKDFWKLLTYFSPSYWFASFFRTFIWILILLFYPKLVVIWLLYVFYKYIVKYIFLFVDIIILDFQLLVWKKWNGNKIYFFIRKIFYWILYFLPCEIIVPFFLSLFKQQTWLNFLDFSLGKFFKGLLNIISLVFSIISGIFSFIFWLENIDEHYRKFLNYYKDLKQGYRLKKYIQKIKKEEQRQKKLELRKERLKKWNYRKLLIFYWLNYFKEYCIFIISILWIPFEWCFETGLRKIWYPLKINIKACYDMFIFWKQVGLFYQISLLYYKVFQYYIIKIFCKIFLYYNIYFWLPLICKLKIFVGRVYYVIIWLKVKSKFFIIYFFQFIGRAFDFFFERSSFYLTWKWRIFYGFVSFFKFFLIIKTKFLIFYEWLKSFFK